MKKKKIKIEIETIVTSTKSFVTEIEIPVDLEGCYDEDDLTESAAKAAKKHFGNRKRKLDAYGDKLSCWEWYSKDGSFCELGALDIKEIVE
jgi:hypothetical protein